MDMQSYLNEIEHAAITNFNIVWNEYNEAQELELRIGKLTLEMQQGYKRAEAYKQYEDLDDYMLGVGIYWDTYFGADKEHFHAANSLEDLRNKIAKLNFSICSLAASILQFAKQGISIVHGNINACSKGRSIGSQEIKDVILQSRNQSLHWEDGRPHPKVVACFAALENDFGAGFSEYSTRNMALDIIRLLGWYSFDAFKNDMQSLA